MPLRPPTEHLRHQCRGEAGGQLAQLGQHRLLPGGRVVGHCRVGDQPWVVADSAFRARLPDLRTTTLPQAVAASVAWARGQQSRAVPAT